MTLSNNTQLKVGALFSGIGGFCIAFEKVGFKTAWAVEKDVDAVRTYRHNFPHTPVIEIDGQPAPIEKVSVEKCGLEPVDVLHAGFPCQSFSQAGARKGFNDSRGRLFFEIIRIIKEFKDKKPSVLVLENTPYIRHGDGGSWFLEISNAIRGAGYWFRDSNCAELDPYDLTDLPQQRNRLFMVAFSIEHFRNGRFGFPQKKVNLVKDLTKFIDFHGKLDDDTYYLPEDNRYYRMLKAHMKDKSVIYQIRKSTVRVKEPGVCPTLTANMGLGGHNVPFIHDAKGIRKLTEHECLKLQGFPDSFSFPDDVPRSRRYVQIGNSVVPEVVGLIAQEVKEKIVKERLVSV